MEPNDLTNIIKDASPGEWIALSMDSTRILGRGKTAEDAKNSALSAGAGQVVLFHVPFPNIGIAAPVS